MFDRETSVGHLTNWAARLFARVVDRQLKPLGISTGQITILLSLENGRTSQQKALVEQAVVEQSALAATLKRMEKSGLIVRGPDPTDGRASLFSLTRSGEAIMDDLHATLEDGNATALAGFDESERLLLVGMLKRIINNIQTELHDRPVLT